MSDEADAERGTGNVLAKEPGGRESSLLSRKL